MFGAIAKAVPVRIMSVTKVNMYLLGLLYACSVGLTDPRLSMAYYFPITPSIVYTLEVIGCMVVVINMLIGIAVWITAHIIPTAKD